MPELTRKTDFEIAKEKCIAYLRSSITNHPESREAIIAVVIQYMETAKLHGEISSAERLKEEFLKSLREK